MRHIIISLMGSLCLIGSVHADTFGFDLAGTDFDTSIVPKGHWAWEQNLPYLEWQKQNDVKQLDVQANALIRIGVGYGAELRIDAGPVWQRTTTDGQKTTLNGMGDTIVGIKKSLETNDPKMTWAVLGQVNLANATHELGVADKIYTLGSSLVYQYADRIQTGMTMYYDKQGQDLAWSAVPNIRYQFNDHWSGVSDLQYRKQESQPEQWLITDSISWSPKDNMQLTASLGYQFSGSAKDYTGGLSIGYLF